MPSEAAALTDKNFKSATDLAFLSYEAFEHIIAAGGMRQAVRVWSRWVTWLRAHPRMRSAKQAEPSAIALTTWLSDVNLCGPTATRGVFAGFK